MVCPYLPPVTAGNKALGLERNILWLTLAVDQAGINWRSLQTTSIAQALGVHCKICSPEVYWLEILGTFPCVLRLLVKSATSVYPSETTATARYNGTLLNLLLSRREAACVGRRLAATITYRIDTTKTHAL
jgi:hypothetical protein